VLGTERRASLLYFTTASGSTQLVATTRPQRQQLVGQQPLVLDFGPGYRVYFGRKGRELVLLLLGGDKGSQKKDIKRAQEFWSRCLKESKG
jgi:putative addiction module killer protein